MSARRLAACALFGALMALRGESARVHAADTPLGVEPDAQTIVFLGPTRPIWLRLKVTVDGRPFRQAWQERFDTLFKQEDRDGDGKLSLDEARDIAREMHGGLRDDGTENLQAWIESKGGANRASLEEYLLRQLPPFVLRVRPVIGQGAALALLPLLDTDNNQQLSAAELSKAEERLAQRDFDDNRVITPGELILDPGAIAAAADPNAEEKDLDADQGPVLVVDAGTTPDSFAQRLLARYDHNHDGRLALSGAKREIQLPGSESTRADANGDGQLEPQELATLLPRSADLELSFALGQATGRSGRTRERAAPRGEFALRKKLNGGFELKLGEAEIDFNRNNRDPRQADLVEMRNFDRDNNQYVDSSEAGAANIGPASFKAMDIDGDGKVFKGELTSYVNRQNEAAAARINLIVRDLGQDLFGILDADGDGLLAPRELRQANTVLSAQDRNGDGVLGGDEIPQSLEFELVRGIDERTDVEARRRVVRSTTQAETTGPLWFRKMDRNNDGDLSPHEFVGPASAFKKLDADGDGLVDRAEAEAAKSP